jgi:hypothetical protein
MWKIVQLKFSEKTITNEPQEQEQQQQQSAIYNQLMIID